MVISCYCLTNYKALSTFVTLFEVLIHLIQKYPKTQNLSFRHQTKILINNSVISLKKNSRSKICIRNRAKKKSTVIFICSNNSEGKNHSDKSSKNIICMTESLGGKL